ncbi:hypothetical protein JKA73_02725 [Myxococcus xanthus]|uniref:hypothetical protein n=1 Tax=Myxococcus xanthus TaxID=34 RepID=UPI00191715F7|nr:hypothetical protein [Myxococcus xanthus]QQR45075.1 hypothetical protein JKA73_02725 [Myxococcus xanthus]
MRKQSACLGLLCSLTVVSLGCSSGATGVSTRRTTNHRDAYAQAACLDSATCCIQRFGPDGCGLSAAEAAVLMTGAQAAAEGDIPDAEAAQNSSLPDWKRRCIQNYVNCKEYDWMGSCYDCMRYCEGQQEWPDDKCRPRGKRK